MDPSLQALLFYQEDDDEKVVNKQSLLDSKHSKKLSDFDIHLHNRRLEEASALSNSLQEKNLVLEAENAQLKLKVEILENNLSRLWKTSLFELRRKNTLINQLNTQIVDSAQTVTFESSKAPVNMKKTGYAYFQNS